MNIMDNSHFDILYGENIYTCGSPDNPNTEWASALAFVPLRQPFLAL